jgi:hypothetical protein
MVFVLEVKVKVKEKKQNRANSAFTKKLYKIITKILKKRTK